MLEEPGLELYPLYYHREDKSFSIADREIPVSSESYKETLFPSGNAVESYEIPDHPVHLGIFGNPITTPRFYDWLIANSTADNLLETKFVMQEVFEELRGAKLEGKPSAASLTSPFGFEAYFLRPGHLLLQVIGNCACLGTNPDGYIVDYHEWDSRYAEYTFHNIDTESQRISLLSGLGHLSKISKKR